MDSAAYIALFGLLSVSVVQAGGLIALYMKQKNEFLKAQQQRELAQQQSMLHVNVVAKEAKTAAEKVAKTAESSANKVVEACNGRLTAALDEARRYRDLLVKNHIPLE